MYEQVPISYSKVTTHLRNRRKRVRFNLNPQLQRHVDLNTELKHLEGEKYQRTTYHKSEIYGERYDLSRSTPILTALEDTFWSYVYSAEWFEYTSLRVTDGSLMMRLMETFYILVKRGLMKVYTTSIIVQNSSTTVRKTHFNNDKNETIKIKFTYYGPSEKGLLFLQDVYGSRHPFRVTCTLPPLVDSPCKRETSLGDRHKRDRDKRGKCRPDKFHKLSGDAVSALESRASGKSKTQRKLKARKRARSRCRHESAQQSQEKEEMTKEEGQVKQSSLKQATESKREDTLQSAEESPAEKSEEREKNVTFEFIKLLAKVSFNELNKRAVLRRLDGSIKPLDNIQEQAEQVDGKLSSESISDEELAGDKSLSQEQPDQETPAEKLDGHAQITGEESTSAAPDYSSAGEDEDDTVIASHEIAAGVSDDEHGEAAVSPQHQMSPDYNVSPDQEESPGESPDQEESGEDISGGNLESEEQTPESTEHVSTETGSTEIGSGERTTTAADDSTQVTADERTQEILQHVIKKFAGKKLRKEMLNMSYSVELMVQKHKQKLQARRQLRHVTFALQPEKQAKPKPKRRRRRGRKAPPRPATPEPVDTPLMIYKKRKAANIQEEVDDEKPWQQINLEKMDFFKPSLPLDFKERCLQATLDFVIRKEQVTTSRGFQTHTTLTVNRVPFSDYQKYKYSL